MMANNYVRHLDEILELFEETNNKSEVSRIIQEKYFPDTNLEYVRRSLTNLINRHSHKKVREEVTKPSGVPFGQVSHYWDKTKNVSAFIKVDEADLIKIEDRIDNIIKEVTPFREIPPSIITHNDKALIATVTDEHIGMNPNPNNKGLFQYEYNALIYKDKLEEFYHAIVASASYNGKFETLFLDNLGDRQDGWNGFTTRGGHELEQNMTNEEVFEVCVESKIRLIDNIIQSDVAENVVLVDVSNDNHSGDFGLMVNMCVSKIINRMYDSKKVQCKIIRKFMEPIYYGDHVFIKTHGKDEKYMKRGLPFTLTDKAYKFIVEYLDHYDIKGYIHVDKGDLHQIGYEKTKRFDYNNFMSFAPPSNWVQHNIGDSYSGFTLRVVPKTINRISTAHHPIYYGRI